jgi:hypothetical protein
VQIHDEPVVAERHAGESAAQTARLAAGQVEDLIKDATGGERRLALDWTS